MVGVARQTRQAPVRRPEIEEADREQGAEREQEADREQERGQAPHGANGSSRGRPREHQQESGELSELLGVLRRSDHPSPLNWEELADLPGVLRRSDHPNSQKSAQLAELPPILRLSGPSPGNRGVCARVISTMRLLLPLVLAVALAAPGLAAACSCAYQGDALERFDRAGVVAHGVVRAEHVPLTNLLARLPLPRWTPRFIWRLARPGVTADVELIQAWKETPTRVITVNLGTGQCCDCTLGPGGLKIGEEVILFGGMRDGEPRLGASNCNPPIEGRRRVKEALALMGPGITDLPRGPRAPFLMKWLVRIGILGALLWAARIWFGGRRSAPRAR